MENAVAKLLKTYENRRRGGPPVQEADAGLRVTDPDGFKIQVIGNTPA